MDRKVHPMGSTFRILCAAGLVAGVLLPGLAAKKPPATKKKAPAAAQFVYDDAKTLKATILQGSECYDPGIAVASDGVWVTWLNFVPDKGDEVWVGRRGADGWAVKQQVTSGYGKYARATLTVDAAGTLWLTYEAFDAKIQRWSILLRRHAGGGKFAKAEQISTPGGNCIHHAVAPDPKVGLWVAWQADRSGQFDILARHVGGRQSEVVVHVIAKTPWSEWHPSVSAGPNGNVYVAWDAYDGESYNVLIRRQVDGEWGEPTPVATGPAFQGRAQVAANTDGQAWVLWEQGAENWGRPYRGTLGVNSRLSDTYGPLHRFRELHVGLIGKDGAVHALRTPLPMPSYAAAARRTNTRKNSVKIGVFYERGVLKVDRSNRPWVVYRHYYMPQAAFKINMKSHIEEGWRIYARCLGADGWSKPYAFDVPQRDGMQRLSVAMTDTGWAAAWDTGRTDRREDPLPRGVAVASLTHPAGAAPAPVLRRAAPIEPAPAPRPPAATPATVGGKEYALFYGDLHRHTDMSLCRPYFDGSLNDAYRYAMDIAGLDFLGITDHTRDVNNGNVRSQLWWRCTKEVTRHRLAPRFHAMFTYERSMNGTDHNVISLRDDVLRPWQPPLTTFWKELDRDTFTVPHAPVHAKDWDYQDDDLRPLIEIYQGCRDVDSRKMAHVGLGKGYHLGFIASSDHISTSASFACVWAPKAELESIFRSMQTRRTYGATDRIRLVFRSGDHWMGERFTASAPPEFQIEIDATGAIEKLGICVDGKPDVILPVAKGATSIRTTWRPDKGFEGKHYVYVYMKQTDGNQAWSSPIRVDVTPAR